MSELLADKNSVGVIVARMQVPYLTDSHRKVIKTVIDRHQKTYLFLGVDDRTDLIKNPFPFYFRKEMIEKTFGEACWDLSSLVIIPVFDLPGNNQDWVTVLDVMITNLILPKEATLYGGRDSFVEIYTSNGGRFKTQELSPSDYDSGTELREIISNRELKYSRETATAILATIKTCNKK